MRIGVLASQGAFVEHIAILHQLKVEALPVRLPRELDGLGRANHSRRRKHLYQQVDAGLQSDR